jgi:hypothetical protein
MSNLLNNNNYYKLSAYSLKLNGLDVQTEIDNLTNAETWTNTDGGSVEPSTGLVLITNGIGNNAVANESIEITDTSINLDNNVNIGSTGTTYELLVNGNPVVNPNVWINSDGITSNGNRIPFTDSSPNGMTTNQSLTFAIDPQNNPTLTVGGTQMISVNNNMFLRSADNIETGNNMILKGPASIQTSFQHGTNNSNDYVKTYVDKDTFDFICDNQIGSKNVWIGATGYYFDNSIYVNGIEIGATGATGPTGPQGDTGYTGPVFIPIQNLSNYYVSSTSGSDLNGTGSIINPWQSIGYAVSILNAVVGDITAVINVASGQYSESDIIITKSGISIIGANSISTIFTGDIYFNMAVSSLFYSVGQLANISVYGCIYHANLHLFSNSLSISGIISAPPNGKSNVIMSGGAGIGGDCSITNNSILYANSDTVPIVLNQTASLTGVGFQIQNNPTLSFTLQSYIQVLDSARCNLFGCSLINSSNNANVGALIDIYNTLNVTSSSTINNCIFLYPAGVASTTGAIINFRNTASSNTVNFYNNFCRCFLTQNAPNNYIVLKSGGGAVNFSQAQNIGRNPQHHIPATGAFAGWTKTSFPTVI